MRSSAGRYARAARHRRSVVDELKGDDAASQGDSTHWQDDAHDAGQHTVIRVASSAALYDDILVEPQPSAFLMYSLLRREFTCFARSPFMFCSQSVC